MLNSAAGVQFPKVTEPPIILNSFTRSTIWGSRLIAAAIFVNGPVAINVTSSVFITVSTIKSTACLLCAFIVGSGSTGPSSPVSP